MRDVLLEILESNYGDRWKHHKTYLEKLDDRQLAIEAWQRAWEMGYDIGYDTGGSDARREREFFNQDQF